MDMCVVCNLCVLLLPLQNHLVVDIVVQVPIAVPLISLQPCSKGPTAFSSKRPRRARASATMWAAIQKHVATIVAQEDDRIIQEVCDYLQQNKDQAKVVLIALQSG